MNEKAEQFCKVVRESFKETYIVYNYGACYNFYLILKEVFPKAEAYFYDANKGHIVTKIDNDYYDIEGITLDDEYLKPIKLTKEEHIKWKKNTHKMNFERMRLNYENHSKLLYE